MTDTVSVSCLGEVCRDDAGTCEECGAQVPFTLGAPVGTYPMDALTTSPATINGEPTTVTVLRFASPHTREVYAAGDGGCLSEAEAAPVDTEPVACGGTYCNDDGVCHMCLQTVPYERFEPPAEHRYTCRALPHSRQSMTFLVTDPSGCSCGGMHGELGDLDRVSCLREKIGGEPVFSHTTCVRPWSDHLCPRDWAAQIRSVLEEVGLGYGMNGTDYEIEVAAIVDAIQKSQG